MCGCVTKSLSKTRKEKTVFLGKLISKVGTCVFHVQPEGSISYREILKQCDILASNAMKH